MMTNSAQTEPLYIGIDGGGTKCRAVIYSTQRGVLGTGLGGPANPLHGLERALESIMVATQLALRDAGMALEDVHRLTAGLGLAGVNLPHLYDKISQWAHPYDQMHLTTDLHTACIGAHEGTDGAVIITGTGSCGFSQVSGKALEIGGHGFVVGDMGSGAWLGLEAVKAVLLDLDGLGPKTALTDALKQYFNTNSAMGIAGLMAGQPSSRFASLSHLVFAEAKSDDALAKDIISRGASYINALALRLLENKPPRISMIGGLAEPLRDWLDSAIVRQLAPPKQPPEMGAVYFARQQSQQL